MIEIRQSRVFIAWLAGLKDGVARGRIAARIRRLTFGHLGDVKSLGGGVSELRVDVGPGYRIYFGRTGDEIVLLLCGGDKGSQNRDILRAKTMIRESLYDT